MPKDLNNYGRAALLAAKALVAEKANTPDFAWEVAIKKIFPDSESSRRKSCPRGAFLGLCKIGALKGIQHSSAVALGKNEEYANRAVTALRSNPALMEDKRELWRISCKGTNKVHNQQMDVVIALWRNGFLE